MVGALGATLTRSRRRFGDGGGVEEGTWDTGEPQAPGVGALISARPSPTSGGSDASDPNRYGEYSTQPGALSRAVPPPPTTPEEKIDRSTQAANAISADIMSSAGIQTPSYLTPPDGLSAASKITDPADAPDATNLPMLAAGAAMLAPTKTGSFSESLGAAFAAAVPVAMKQREITENTQLRAAQMEQNAAIWGQRNANTADRNNTYAQSVAARARLQDAQEALARAKAAGGGSGNGHKTAADYQEEAVQDLMGREDPSHPGQNYTRADAVMTLKGVTQRTEHQHNQDTLGRDKYAAAQTQIEASNDYKERSLALRQRLGDNADTAKMLHDAANMAAQMGQPGKLGQYLDDIVRARSRTSPGGGGGSGGGGGAKGVPLPANATENTLTDGVVYSTAKGLGKWDAASKTFLPVGQ